MILPPLSQGFPLSVNCVKNSSFLQFPYVYHFFFKICCNTFILCYFSIVCYITIQHYSLEVFTSMRAEGVRQYIC